MYRIARREGLDAVLGYRQQRQDTLGRRLASQFARGVRQCVLHDSIRDIGCSTRIVRREVLDQLQPVENQHRYLPALIELGGWRIAQVPARHHERRWGISKYGNLERGLQGLRDLPRIKTYTNTLKERSEKGASS
jgi:dolichol-phosphate mannosyltransferase